MSNVRLFLEGNKSIDDLFENVSGEDIIFDRYYIVDSILDDLSSELEEAKNHISNYKDLERYFSSVELFFDDFINPKLNDIMDVNVHYDPQGKVFDYIDGLVGIVRDVEDYLLSFNGDNSGEIIRGIDNLTDEFMRRRKDFDRFVKNETVSYDGLTEEVEAELERLKTDYSMFDINTSKSSMSYYITVEDIDGNHLYKLRYSDHPSGMSRHARGPSPDKTLRYDKGVFPQEVVATLESKLRELS